ncbi:hypothetical protein HPP92_005870 [Vanilla planifolia]|uniref:Uncharacterized protein n=1 Tax=Vanilla planifolia TaxID=51239 RepID=A0A835VFU0_VANPL|nr:hypothetical protein HPP92_005870 [Vanilla planifolia]
MELICTHPKRICICFVQQGLSSAFWRLWLTEESSIDISSRKYNAAELEEFD